MKTPIIVMFLNSFLCTSAQAQFEWQDPLQVGKEWLIFNVAGTLVSHWLTTDTSTKKTWHHDIYSEYQHEYGSFSSATNLFALKMRSGVQIRRWLRVGVEMQLYRFKNDVLRTSGLGSNIWFNWNLFNRPKFRIYFDNGFGIVGTAKNFPKGGTRFNFTTDYGLSVDVKLKNSLFIMVGARNMHISNAYIFGEDRNPAFDSIGFIIGVSFN